jgi:hypothetical protein
MSDMDTEDYDLKASYKELSANLMQPHKFAKIFCEAARSQTPIVEVLQENIKKLIKTDPDTARSIKEYQQQVNKDDLMFTLKKTLDYFRAITLMILGGIFTAIIKRYF